MLTAKDHDRVRLITFERPEALNAFCEELYDAATDALLAADDDPAISVVVLTGTGRAFCAGQDLGELRQRTTDPDGFTPGRHGFVGFIEALAGLSKPLVCAVNGLGVGLGATMLGYADLVFMSSDARLRCPFTSLGVAPEAGSSFLFPRMMGRQEASWLLLSSEWIDAERCREVGLAWKVCAPEELLDVALDHAGHLAGFSLESLVEGKRLIVGPLLDGLADARAREGAAFGRLLGLPASSGALEDFAGG
ncbi:MAG: enoyl-CoA hydratase/isomerase family protein [Actinobacteria bacterium]|nr:enoyl-CoA hydratase/isomerase family protein [Actinomycetota bacterium]